MTSRIAIVGAREHPDLKVISVALLHVPSSMVHALPAPNRHHNLINALAEAGVDRKYIADCEQGFLLSDGRFARRKPALIIAERASQIVKGPTAPAHGLFSEDVW